MLCIVPPAWHTGQARRDTVNTITPATVQEHGASGPLDGAIASFLTQLQEAGYAKESLRNKRTVVRTFADWLRRRHITVHAINESQ
jgi:hypothetical protein